MEELKTLIESLLQRYSGSSSDEFRGTRRLIVPRGSMFAVLSELKSSHGFDLLVDVTCVDYLDYRGANRDQRPPARFGLVYLLCHTTTGQRLTIRVYLDEDDLSVPSVVSLWEGANWLEREVYDMFGITFQGHGDLRRILLPPEFTAFPLRKDYPLQGRGERHNFPVIARGDA